MKHWKRLPQTWLSAACAPSWPQLLIQGDAALPQALLPLLSKSVGKVRAAPLRNA